MGNKFSGEMLPPSFSIETPDTVTGMFLSPNKKVLAIGYDTKNIRIYDLQAQAIIKDIEGCCFSQMTDNVINVAFMPDSSKMAYRWDEGIRIMDLNTYEMEREINNEHSWVTAAFSPDGKFLMIGGTKDYVSIYDLSKDSSMALIKKVEGRVHQHVQVSKDYHYK